MNLLAFSGGVDSTALFFHLLDKMEFDIAIVNYKTRPSSDEEVEYAKELAKKYNKKIFIKICKLEKFSEAEARKCRYKFFEEIIKEYGYKQLITAHQLNDRFEWFLMQLSKGAGLKELISLREKEEREFYTIYRPFINRTKEELLQFLNENRIKYFVDESNFDQKFKRNFFRENFSNPFLNQFREGVKRSFKYLEEDLELLFQKDWKKTNKLYTFKKSNPKIDIKKVDLILKELGILPTKSQKDEILKTDFSCVVGGKIAIDNNDEKIFIAPFVKIKMAKEFKEKMRREKIPPKVRGYIFKTTSS